MASEEGADGGMRHLDIMAHGTDNRSRKSSKEEENDKSFDKSAGGWYYPIIPLCFVDDASVSRITAAKSSNKSTATAKT